MLKLTCPSKIVLSQSGDKKSVRLLSQAGQSRLQHPQWSPVEADHVGDVGEGGVVVAPEQHVLLRQPCELHDLAGDAVARDDLSRAQAAGAGRARTATAQQHNGQQRCLCDVGLEHSARTAIPGAELMILLCVSAASGKHEQIMCLVTSSITTCWPGSQTPSSNHSNAPTRCLVTGSASRCRLGCPCLCTGLQGRCTQDQQVSGRAQEAPRGCRCRRGHTISAPLPRCHSLTI